MRLLSRVPAGGLRFGISLSTVITLGCKESPDEPASIAPCTAAVTISVNATTTQPRFTWTPACAVSMVIITSAPAVGTPTEHWRVQADRTVIGPPVMYGRLPTGAQSTSLIPLTSNQDYHISIYIPDRATAVGDASWHQP